MGFCVPLVLELLAWDAAGRDRIGPCPLAVTRMRTMDQDHGKDQPNGPPPASGSPGSANGLVTGAMGATEDEQLLNRPMPSEPVPRSAEWYPCNF